MLKIYDIRIAIFIDFIEPSVYKGFQSKADLAQLVELLICNQWVGGSSPSVGTIKKSPYTEVFFYGMNFWDLNPSGREPIGIFPIYLLNIILTINIIEY